MARDPLALLARVREAAATDAKRKLAAAIVDARKVEEAVASHARDVAREQEEALGDDVAAFAAWLPAARAQERGLADRLDASEGQISELRRVFAARRRDAEAVVKAIERREVEAASATARKDQDAMDEVAGRHRLDSLS